MNWEAVGAVAELLGSITILVTLIYLSIQTRSISKQSQAEARYNFVDASAEINMTIAQSKEAASVWRRGLESIKSLDEDETMQFLMFMGQYANLWSVMHQLYEEKLVPEAQWRVVRSDIASILKSDGGRYFWGYGGAKAFDESFAEFVENELLDEDRPYNMEEMTR